MRQYYVYILATKKLGALYIGVTNHIALRTWQHKEAKQEGHSKKYFIRRLVYVEIFSEINDAIAREKCLKRWKRDWKIELINKANPEWNDLYDQLVYV